MRSRKLLILVLLSTLMGTQVAQAQEAEQWLERMAEAVEQRNYEGTFVYITPGKAETFKVYHRVVDGEVVERIVAMDGAGAEIIRNSSELICIFPKRKSVVVETRNLMSPSDSSRGRGNPLQAALPTYSGSLAEYYELEVLPADRVLGRDVAVVAIRPRDEYRYGYRLWLDAETALPLKTQLIGADAGMPVEEIRFTTLKLPERVGVGAVQTQLDTSDFEWIRQNEAAPAEAVHDAEGVALAKWSATDMPAGFMLMTEAQQFIDDSGPRTHMVYSDGLATVSVFVDIDVAASEQVEGLSMMGAANAYSVVKEGLLVTAMGEVPPQTVERIAYSMQLNPAE